MREVELELAPELAQIAIGDDLLARLQEVAQVVLQVDDLTVERREIIR